MRKRGYSQIGDEVSFYDLRVDLYGYSPANDKTVAIELKLARWRRAFVQAIQYTLCADVSYIALPASVIPRVDTALLAAHGLGLLSVLRYSCEEILAPNSKGFVRDDYRDQMIDQLHNKQTDERLTA